MESFLSPGEFYYHPLTRVQNEPRRLVQWPDGAITEIEQNFSFGFKTSLTAEDIVRYYYNCVGYPTEHLSRDMGGVKYLIGVLGLDVTLFAIDILANEYLNAEMRPSLPPDIIKAKEYSQLANDQLGRVKQVAVEYHIDESSFYV